MCGAPIPLLLTELGTPDSEGIACCSVACEGECWFSFSVQRGGVSVSFREQSQDDGRRIDGCSEGEWGWRMVVCLR